MRITISTLDEFDEFLKVNDGLLTSDQIKIIVGNCFKMYYFEPLTNDELIDRLRKHEKTPISQRPIFL